MIRGWIEIVLWLDADLLFSLALYLQENVVT